MASPGSVIVNARPVGIRRSQPSSSRRSASRAPRAPARWWRCSLQSTGACRRAVRRPGGRPDDRNRSGLGEAAASVGRRTAIAQAGPAPGGRPPRAPRRSPRSRGGNSGAGRGFPPPATRHRRGGRGARTPSMLPREPPERAPSPAGPAGRRARAGCGTERAPRASPRMGIGMAWPGNRGVRP